MSYPTTIISSANTTNGTTAPRATPFFELSKEYWFVIGLGTLAAVCGSIMVFLYIRRHHKSSASI